MKRCIALLTTAILALVAFLAPATAQAAVVTNISIDISFALLVPCADGGVGEVIEMSGPLHILVEITADAAGGFHEKLHFQPQGISGTGLTTGDKYQATGVTQQEFNIPSSGTFETTFVNNFRMIGQGPGNNLLVHQTFHETFNANGDMTAFVDNSSIDCK